MTVLSQVNVSFSNLYSMKMLVMMSVIVHFLLEMDSGLLNKTFSVMRC